MSEDLKLYNNKPKKAQLKQAQMKAKDFTVPPSASSSSSTTAPTAAASYSRGSQGGSIPPPPPPKESFARRYKFLWPLLLTVNLAVGGYVFFRTKKKDSSSTNEDTTASSNPGSTATEPSVAAERIPSMAMIPEMVKIREPISEEEQRELFKWVLDEKRKMKPKDPEEKKRIDEEKAILKQFIRAKTIPTL